MFFVAYQDPTTGRWTRFERGGMLNPSDPSWTLSPTVNLQPSDVSGWQAVRFLFASFVPRSDPQLYDFYVDPYAKG